MSETPREPAEPPKRGPRGPRTPYPVDDPPQPNGPGSEPDVIPPTSPEPPVRLAARSWRYTSQRRDIAPQQAIAAC